MLGRQASLWWVVPLLEALKTELGTFSLPLLPEGLNVEKSFSLFIKEL